MNGYRIPFAGGFLGYESLFLSNSFTVDLGQVDIVIKVAGLGFSRTKL